MQTIFAMSIRDTTPEITSVTHSRSEKKHYLFVAGCSLESVSVARFSPIDLFFTNSVKTQSTSCTAITNSACCLSHWLGIAVPHHDNAIRTRNRPLAPPCSRAVQSAPLGT